MKTGHKPQPPRCALGNLGASSYDTEAVKRDGWLQHRILVVGLDDPRLDMIGREFVKQIGRKLYGKEVG